MPGSAKGSVLVGLAMAAVLCSCTAHANEAATPSSDRSLITPTQFADYHFNSAFDAVASLRANWFNTKGPDSFTKPSVVRVYLDNVLLGDTGTLRQIPLTNITYMKYYDGVAATARWGLDHGAGAIFVSTRPMPMDQTP
jgi:hypothetical protein